MRAQVALSCMILSAACAVSPMASAAIIFEEPVSLPDSAPTLRAQLPEGSTASSQDVELAVRPTRSVFFELPPTGHALTEISASMSTRRRAERMVDYGYGTDGRIVSTTESTVAATTEATEFALATTYGFAERSYFGLDVGYAKSSYQVEGAPAEHSGGLRDIGLNLTRVSESRKFIYGIGATLSPSTARPAQGWWGVGNSFSGQHALHSYLGYETMQAKALLGAKVAVHLPVAELKPEGLQSSNATGSFDVTGFYEFPIIKNLSFGAAVALSGDESIFSDSMAERAFIAKAYANAKLLDDTEAKVAVEGISTQLTNENTAETRVSVGLLKTL